MNLNMEKPWLLKSRDWLESVQRPDGGWGERCNTYDDPVHKGQGPSTASQTAWAVMGFWLSEIRIVRAFAVALSICSDSKIWMDPGLKMKPPGPDSLACII